MLWIPILAHFLASRVWDPGPLFILAAWLVSMLVLWLWRLDVRRLPRRIEELERGQDRPASP